MEVPFRLTLREVPAAVEAFLLFAGDPAPLAAACAALGGEELPSVFAVRGGFLVVPAAGLGTRAIPGAIRLRRLAGDLFIPADADLIPALLSEEAAALTQHRGLVFLPGGDVLAFAPTPLLISEWLAPVRVHRIKWEPFPTRPHRPESLSVIERPAPPAALMELLGDGAPDDANPLSDAGESVPEDARPPTGSGSTLGKIAANTQLAIGGFLAWMGKQLGTPGLASLGGNLARKALEAIPRLSEKVLGEQEAALREVLRQLQSGDIEKALRRAPIAVGDPDQPARVGTDARLGNRDPRYSLRDLIGSGGGAATAWLGGGDIWNELAREYRRLAEEATARGDFRRAAYLYGVLLRDLRSAANVLMAGGLCRDAALLFRDRLNDPLAAANAFERAGDHDEALRLFEKYGHFEKAAELLRRLGDEDRAVEYFVRAADQLAGRGHMLGAGELVRAKAGRRDLAIGYFRRGWVGIRAESVTCGERLLDEHLVAEDLSAVNALLFEAETNLADRASDAGHFFNYALRVGERVLPAETRDDLADRVRLLFASHLRAAGSSTEGVRLAGELFGQHQPWAGRLVRDASFAVLHKDRVLPTATGPTHPPPVKLADGTVTAIAVARGTFDVVVATTEAVVMWRVNENRVVPVSKSRSGRVVALSVDAVGKIVYVLLNGVSRTLLRSFVANHSDSYSPCGSFGWDHTDSDTPIVYLQPSASYRNQEVRVTVATLDERQTFVGVHLKPMREEAFQLDGADIRLLAEATSKSMWQWSGSWVRYWVRDIDSEESWRPSRAFDRPWTPPEQGPISAIDWITTEMGRLEVAGIDSDNCVCWAAFDASNYEESWSRFASASHSSRYVAASLTGPNAVVAVTTQNEVHWFRVAGKTLERVASLTLDVPTAAVALVARPTQNEVIAILADGYAVRLTRP